MGSFLAATAHDAVFFLGVLRDDIVLHHINKVVIQDVAVVLEIVKVKIGQSTAPFHLNLLLWLLAMLLFLILQEFFELHKGEASLLMGTPAIKCVPIAGALLTVQFMSCLPIFLIKLIPNAVVFVFVSTAAGLKIVRADLNCLPGLLKAVLDGVSSEQIGVKLPGE